MDGHNNLRNHATFQQRPVILACSFFTEARQGSGKRIVSLLTAQTKSEVDRIQGQSFVSKRREKLVNPLEFRMCALVERSWIDRNAEPRLRERSDLDGDF